MRFETMATTQEELYPGPAELITRLPIGDGIIGHEFGKDDPILGTQLAEHTKPISRKYKKTAFCPDGRLMLGLADGTTDPEVLRQIVTHQLLGGLGLATTKAAVASDLLIVRDATSFTNAYETIYDFLYKINYRDGGHASCGASASVEGSVEKE